MQGQRRRVYKGTPVRGSPRPLQTTVVSERHQLSVMTHKGPQAGHLFVGNPKGLALTFWRPLYTEHLLAEGPPNSKPRTRQDRR